MTSTHAPEPVSALQESHSTNDRMRHVPSLDWIIAKVDGDLRRKVGLAWVGCTALHGEQRAAAEEVLRSLCRHVERITETARYGKPMPVSGDLGQKLELSVKNASACLRNLDHELFGRRWPMQTCERSIAEPVWGAVLSVIAHLRDEVIPFFRRLDPDFDALILDGLVAHGELSDEQLRTPMA